MRAMDSDRQWHLAWAKLTAFRENLPPSIEEKHVAEFHSCLDLLESATTEDLSSFRIPGHELKLRVVTVRRPSFVAPGLMRPTQVKYCDRNLMVRQIDGVYNYFNSIQPPSEKPKYGY
jgi:hypothetical protein